MNVSALLGLTLLSVSVLKNDDYYGDSIVFNTTDGRSFRMYHGQNCCESVHLEDVVGEWNDLVGEPLLMAEESTSENVHPPGLESESNSYNESFTWTFYKFATRKGYVDLRWFGQSNGYYSESVDFQEITNGNG